MKRKPFDLNGWTAQIDEISAGVYEISAKHASGAVFQMTGTDTDELEAQAFAYARSIEKNIEHKG
jgi:hypothetical protein